ncbi:MAG: ABC-2 family transporter protein [Bacilli bacterium]
MHYFQLYIEFIKLRILGIAEYRKAFLIGAAAQIASYGAEFFLIWVVVTKFQTINGWHSNEVLFLYGLNLCSYAMAGFFFFSPTSQLSVMIKNGTFDEILTKPLNSFWYLVCREFNTGYASHFVLSSLVIAYSLYALKVDISLGFIVFLFLTLIGAALIQAAALIMTSVPSFWVVENKGLKDILFFQARNFIRYPISIYKLPIQILLTLILPYAFINFYPSQFLLGKNDILLFNPALQFMTPIVGAGLFAFAYYFWTLGVRQYKSTGS